MFILQYFSNGKKVLVYKAIDSTLKLKNALNQENINQTIGTELSNKKLKDIVSLCLNTSQMFRTSVSYGNILEKIEGWIIKDFENLKEFPPYSIEFSYQGNFIDGYYDGQGKNNSNFNYI